MLPDGSFPRCVFATALSLSACRSTSPVETPDPGPSTAEIVGARASGKAAGLLDLANADLVAGRPAAAIRRAEQVLADDENNADAYTVMGAAQTSTDFDASVAAYERALEIDPAHYGAALGLASKYHMAGRDREALALIDGLIADDEEQVDPHIFKLQIAYAQLDARTVAEEADAIFLRLPYPDPALPFVLTANAFARPLVGKGPFCVASGRGSSTFGLDPQTGFKFARGQVGGETTEVVLMETAGENVIDRSLVDTLQLEPVGQFVPLDAATKADIVIVPEVTFGSFSIRNVPAYVASLEAAYHEPVGETPGLRLGRHALGHVGAMTFDFPRSTVQFSSDPTPTPSGAIESPLLMVSAGDRSAPIVPITLGGSEHPIYMYLGGLYPGGLTVTQEQYFASGFLPRHVDPPDDLERGLKMVYVDEWTVGGTSMAGVGGLVLLHEPPDDTIQYFRDAAWYEIGGFINVNQFEGWRLTMSLPQGKIVIEP